MLHGVEVEIIGLLYSIAGEANAVVVWQIYGYGALDKPLMLLDCNGGNGYRLYDWDT